MTAFYPFLTGLCVGGGSIAIMWSVHILRQLRAEKRERAARFRECLEPDPIHGDVPRVRRNEVVHDYTEAAQ